MAIKFTAILPGGFDRKKFLQEITRSMQKEGELIGRTYARFFDSWEEKPEIRVRTRGSSGDRFVIQTIIYPKADEGLLQIAEWVIHGTDPYDFDAPNPWPMRFPEVYLPSTSPGVIQSQPHSYHGADVRAYHIEHPGIEPRNTIQAVEDAWRKPFVEDMIGASFRAIDKAKKKPRKVSL